MKGCGIDNCLTSIIITSIYISGFTFTHPTLYMYRKKDKPYHIDYCFVSADLAEKLESVEIGAYDQWVQYSDHVSGCLSSLKMTVKTLNFKVVSLAEE